MRNSTWHRHFGSSFQEFSHLFSDEITYYIYIYIYICVYIDICQSEIQQIQDHKNLIAPIRFQITQCITPNPKGHLSSHLQGRGVVDHDGIPHLQPWSKFQHPTQLFNPPSRSHLDDFHHEIQTVFHRGRHSSLNFVSKPPVGATDSVQGLMWQ